MRYYTTVVLAVQEGIFTNSKGFLSLLIPEQLLHRFTLFPARYRLLRGFTVRDFEGECEYMTKYISGKAAYIERNQAMIYDSDFCVFYYDKIYLPSRRRISKCTLNDYQPQSGTALAYEYAVRSGKQIINLFQN